MNSLFEYTDRLQTPYECFLFDMNSGNFPVQPHWHYFAELIYMVEGKAMMHCGEESFVAEEGELVFFLPHQIHSIYAVAAMPLKYYVMKFDVSQLAASTSTVKTAVNGIHFQSLLRSAKEQNSAKIHFTKNELEELPIQRIFQETAKEMQQQEYGYSVVVQSYISTLLVFILRQWRQNGFDTNKSLALLSEEETIYSITEYIDANIHENLKVEALAQRCHMSYSYFAKVFREVYGQSCKKYIEFVRLCKAEDLLRFTNLDLNCISQETGFSDCSHFIKAFKEKYGMTPNKYRTSF